MAVHGSTRAEKGVHINNSAGRCESGCDVAEALDFWGDCFLEFLYFVFRGDGDSIRYIYSCSVECKLCGTQYFWWRLELVSKEADASKIIPFSCIVFVKVVEVLVWQRKVFSWFPGRWNIHEEPHRCRSGVVCFSNIFLRHRLRLSAA